MPKPHLKLRQETMSPNTSHENKASAGTGHMMPNNRWDDCYPDPAWDQVAMGDLASFLAASSIRLEDVHSIVDLGGGAGRRIIHAIAANPDLNRTKLHVTCVDISVRAIEAGINAWARLRAGLSTPGYPDVQPKWSMTFRVEDATKIPCDILASKPDVAVDWMMTHSLPIEELTAHSSLVKQMSPKWLLIKSFSTEGNTLPGPLQQATEGVVKQQRSRSDFEQLYGTDYRLISGRQCKEQLDVRHSDGPEAAKCEFLFARTGTSRRIHPPS